MTRRTFIKKMMALGFSRNALTKITRELINERDKRRQRGEIIYVTWMYVYNQILMVNPTKLQMENFNKKWG